MTVDTRKTQKRIPTYQPNINNNIFILKKRIYII